MIDVAEVKRRLRAAGLSVVSQVRLPTDLGTQMRTRNGTVINLYDTGAINVQGKNVEAVEDALELAKKERSKKVR